MTDSELLAEAKTALHKLLTGRQAAEFRDQNGEMVRYTRANLAELRRYITELEARVSPPTVSGPLRPFF